MAGIGNLRDEMKNIEQLMMKWQRCVKKAGLNVKTLIACTVT